jgi:DNA polymerase-3 subunit alpha
MIQLEKKDEYAVLLEPKDMNVAADRGWVERVEVLFGRGSIQAID